jgi:hypothetical protein
MGRRSVIAACVAVVAAGLIATISPASGASSAGLHPRFARIYDLTIDYSGVYHDDYTNSGTGGFRSTPH